MRSILKLLAMSIGLFISFSACTTDFSGRDLDPIVSDLVKRLAGTQKQRQAAVDQIELLGGGAIPYLVGHLEDNRPLASPGLVMTNRDPSGFESRREYTPETVHDVISAILNEATGQSFVFAYNGGTAIERKNNASQWVLWCQKSFPDMRDICARNEPLPKNPSQGKVETSPRKGSVDRKESGLDIH